LKIVGGFTLGETMKTFLERNFVPLTTPPYFADAHSFLRKESGDFVFKVLYLSLQVFDLGLTLMAAYFGFSELNPLMKALLASPLQLATFKLIIPFLIVWLLPGKFLIPAIALLAAVIGWNVKELLLLAF
jgi:hypothetical protein